MTGAVRAALAEGAAQLRDAGIESARIDARVLLAAAINASAGEVFGRCELSSAEQVRFAGLLARRAAREPLAYITGHKEFWSLSFAVGPGALIPRPETETLVEAALRESDAEKPLRVLDIGTGSGCLLIAFLVERPKATGVGLDASEGALAWARRNAVDLGRAPRGHLELASWEPAGTERFDVILANPPYLTATEFDATEPEIRLWEPRSALVAGEDGLEAFRAMAPVLSRRLAEGGKAFIEIGIGQALAVGEILARSGVDVHGVTADLSGIPRCLVLGQAGCGG